MAARAADESEIGTRTGRQRAGEHRQNRIRQRFTPQKLPKVSGRELHSQCDFLKSELLAEVRGGRHLCKIE
jgi:hypothetical protein